MFTILQRASASLLLLGVAGCSIDAATYTIDRYGTVSERQIRLGCRDTYQVYDRPDAGTLLVVTNGYNELLASACDGVDALPRPERMRRTASIFLRETTARPDCRIVRESETGPLHTEFAYRCPMPVSRRAADLTRAQPGGR